MSLISTYRTKYVDEFFIMLNKDTIFRDRSRRNEVRNLDETERGSVEWMSGYAHLPIIRTTSKHSLNKCAPLARFISFVPCGYMTIKEQTS